MAGTTADRRGDPALLDLVDRGIIRIIDVAFMAKDADGTVGALDLASLDGDSAFAEFEGASTGLIGQEDLEEAANALEPGTSAAVLVWENRWAAPVAAAMRRSGGQLVASGRIPVQAVLAALDALEAATASEELSHAGSASRCRPHRRRRRDGDRRQQPRLAPPGQPLGRAGRAGT